LAEASDEDYNEWKTITYYSLTKGRGVKWA